MINQNFIKMKEFLLAIIFIFQICKAQTVVWSDDFTAGGGNWTLNLDGAVVIPGSTPADVNPGNQWVINSTYTGGPFFTTIPPSPNGGNYLHITPNDPQFQQFVSFGFADYGCLFFTGVNANKVVRLTNPIPGATLSGGPYLLEFEWICQGDLGSAYATLIYSVNGGPWQEYLVEYSGQANWQIESINLGVLGWNPGESFSFGFRWRNESSGSDPAFGVDNIKIVQTGSGPSNSITTNSISPTNYCAGGNISVGFTSTGTFNAGNVYTLQMSDATGSFASPVSIGTLTSVANSGTINGTIPLSTPADTGYRFRVVSSSPSVTGTNNGQNITIQETVQPDVTISASSNTACVGQNIDFNSIVTGADNASISYQWLINGIPLGGNTPTFTTNTLQAGSTVRLVVTVTGACNTAIDTSNVITMQGITVSCSTNTNTVFINTSGGTPPYTFRVDNFGDGASDSLTNVSSNSASFTHNYSSTGVFNVQVSVTDANGCTAISNCSLNNTTTSYDNLQNSKLSLYPNPFNEYIILSFDETINSPIYVYVNDLMGRILITQTFDGDLTKNIFVDTQKLVKGVYFIHVIYKNEVFGSKIVK
jgi:hypothetical protein